MAEVEARGEMNRRRSSGGIRRNASHDISDQIENKLADLKKVKQNIKQNMFDPSIQIAKDESSFTEEVERGNSEPPVEEEIKNLSLKS